MRVPVMVAVPRAALSRPESSALEIEIAADAVVIRHPGLGGGPLNALFRFPAYSEPNPADPSKPLFGVCHHLALDACRVLTNHAADDRAGFLALDCEGKTAILIDDVALLSPGDYYYYLGSPEDAANRNYPIVKVFSAFRFPSRIPENWYTARRSGRFAPRGQNHSVSSETMSYHVAVRDEFCTATRCQGFTQCAYLVPKAEAAWFLANEMFVYSPDTADARVDSHTNGILLRDDVHRCLDSHAFVFYPAGSDSFMAYFVDVRGHSDYTELLHRRLVAIHPSVAVEFLYARFAYNVIHLSRFDNAFDSVPENPAITVCEEMLASEEAAKREREDAKLLATEEDTRVSEASGSSVSEKSRVSGDNGDPGLESSFVSNRSNQCPPEESYEDGDARWKERLLERLPEIATLEEVEHPPDGVACHTETPHMLRLKSQYMKENPQVWRTSAVPEDATREDSEGFLAEWMTRPT